jgi:plasmid maintenance system antidote protein VapI
MSIDTAILSKIERGDRKITKEQVIKLSEIFGIKNNEYVNHFFSDKIANEIADLEDINQILKLAEEKALNIKKNKWTTTLK